jgi:hypothetical protein
VQLARKRSPLLLLDVDQPRGQTLEVLTIALLDAPLAFDLALAGG